MSDLSYLNRAVRRENWENRKGVGGGNVSCNFGGECSIESALQNQFWRLRKWDSSGLCPFLLRKMTGCEQTRGGNLSWAAAEGGAKRIA